MIIIAKVKQQLKTIQSTKNILNHDFLCTIIPLLFMESTCAGIESCKASDFSQDLKQLHHHTNIQDSTIFLVSLYKQDSFI